MAQLRFSDQEKMAEIQVEISYRIRVFARMVAEGTMTEEDAARRLDIMREISDEYEERIQPRLI
jgi:hypothetical protein